MASHHSTSSEASEAGETAGARISLRSLPGLLLSQARTQPIRTAVAGLVFFLALTGIGLGAWAVVKYREPPAHRPTITSAFAELDAQRYEKAREQAQTLLDDSRLEFDARGGPLLVMGAVVAQEAAGAYNADRKRQLYQAAAGYLSEARDCGFPEGRESEGLFLLATSQFRGEQFEAAIPLLKESLTTSPKRKYELAGMLAQACRRGSPPRPAEALQYNGQYLENPKLSTPQRQAGLLDRAQLELMLGQLEACRKTMEQIPSDGPLDAPLAVLRARLAIHSAEKLRADRDASDENLSQADTLLREAEETLRGIKSRSGSADVAAREAQYLLGICLLRSGNSLSAESQFSRTRRSYRGTPEALAALLEEADLARLDGRHEEALNLYLEILSEESEVMARQNPWVPVSEIRRRLLAAVEGFHQAEEFATAVALATALPPLTPADQAAESLAQVEEAWAQSLARRAAAAPAAEGARLVSESRAKFREAGASFAHLAELRKASREYTEDLWRSAQNHAAGHDYRLALRMYKRYLSEESRKRRSAALVALGECNFALQKLESALVPLQECIENFRKLPESYRARLVASQVYAEQNKLAEAKALLLDNLEHESLAPSSLEWRDSLFALGKLLYREATELETLSRKKGVDSPYPDVVKVGLKELEKSYNAYQEVIARLSEAVQRYPEAPQAIEARFLVAEAHRQAAKWPRKLRASLAIETTRATLHRQALDELSAALAEYEPLLKLLVEKQEQSGLTPSETALMRNCYFARADVLFDLERFDAAIAAYSSATNRYHDQPEALEAFVQIASCYRRMNRPAEARGTLEQAKVVLRRIPADATFTHTTRYDRGEWTQLLNWLSSL